jgi:hypothetical protein
MLEKKIRFLIRETLGYQEEIHQISSQIPKEIINNLIIRDLDENSEDNFLIILDITDEHKENTKINRININVDVKKTNFLKIGGSFKSGYTKEIIEKGNSYFEIFLTIDLNLKEDNFKNLNLLELNIESVISHELNHAFVFLLKYNKKSKSKIYNSSISMTKMSFLDNKIIKDFLNMLYLNLPEEIQARVQETKSVVEKINVNNYNDLINELKKFQPINDAEKMIKYNGEQIKKINDETFNNFIHLFNNDINIKNNSNLNFKTINSKESFINYWVKNINKGGEKLKIKIQKIAVDKLNNINEKSY